jgi:hypothetical protein
MITNFRIKKPPPRHICRRALCVWRMCAALKKAGYKKIKAPRVGAFVL